MSVFWGAWPGRRVVGVVLLCVAGLLQSCGGVGHFHLTLAHLNDTHSHLAPSPVNLTVGGLRTQVQAGGFARLKTLVDETRAANPNVLLLHAGDAVQGTLYYSLFNGQVEFEFLNLLGVDAMTLGNHEFDRGPQAIASFLQWARFPVVSANIDFSGEPQLASRISASVIKEVHGERIGLIGLTTETTPLITRDVGQARFLDARASAAREVAALQAQGVNKIIVLSHLGFEEDLLLAAAVSGIDVIVGGHSHTLLGDATRLAVVGLTPQGSYPRPVLAPGGDTTLVLQAGQWGQVLGRIQLVFDADGRVVHHTANAVMPVSDHITQNGVAVAPGSPAYAGILQAFGQSQAVQVVPENPVAAATLAPYAAALAAFGKTNVATTTDTLMRGVNSGPGPLAADSMLAAVPLAQIAIVNYGGVRKDVPAGPISVGDVLEVLPFANTLVLLDLSGGQLHADLESAVDYLITRYGRSPLPLPYVAGLRFQVAPAAAKGQRVSALAVKDGAGVYQPLDAAQAYRIVVNAYIAAGNDGFTQIKGATGFRSDTGIIDSDAFREYLKRLGTVHNPSEPRAVVLEPLAQWGGPAGEAANDAAYRQGFVVG